MKNTVKSLDIKKLRESFPILSKKNSDGKPLIYLDNAATTQKPMTVIERLSKFLSDEYGTVHRGIYELSYRATHEFELARETARAFINAGKSSEIIFTKGCTEAINLIADSFGHSFFKENDEILVSAMEHHSNIVPWQLLSKKLGVKLKVIPMTSIGELKLEEYEKLLSGNVKLVSLVHVSNVLGTVNPIKEVVKLAHQKDIPVLIDGAQAVSHMPIDVQDIDCDFYAFSGHKMYGPTGVGVLYGKEKYLKAMSPYQGGGEMIDKVSFEETTFGEIPHKFEAGTPPFSEVIALSAAMEFLQSYGLDRIFAHEKSLLERATEKLKEIQGLRIFGEAPSKSGVIAFEIDGVHPYDLATLLDQNDNIAIRTGHHCAQPLMNFYGVSGMSRVSFACYNTQGEIDAFVKALQRALKILL